MLSRDTDVDPRATGNRGPHFLVKPTIHGLVKHITQLPWQHANPTDAVLDGFLGRTQRVGFAVHADAEVVADEFIVLDTRVVLRRGRD